MSETERGQVSASAAQVYERFFVPALFAEPAAKIVNAVGISSGQKVLDVACGTGVLARATANAVGGDGCVVGLDVNTDMLSVARERASGIDWRQGIAEQLPFDDNEFDAVVSQFGLMFFDDRVGALKEMARVTKPGGVVAVAVWDSLESSLGYAAMTDLIEKQCGREAADALRAPFCLGDTAELLALFEEAGLNLARVFPLEVTARFPSLAEWVHTDIRGWTLSDMIDDEQYELLLRAAEDRLARFVTSNGTVAFASPVQLVMTSAD
ncbi:MAG: class I SAM-dependent methyltransferase [Hyphomonadaceae bacterium]|nr:class I SAM-dependent methyltransferase [Hyphomonadaceae bacterium]